MALIIPLYGHAKPAGGQPELCGSSGYVPGEMPYDVNFNMAQTGIARQTMIPLKDDTPRLSTPLVNYFLIAANVVVFLFQISLDRRSQSAFVRDVRPGAGAAG